MTPAFAEPLAGGQRASSRVLAAMPARVAAGRDLIEVIYGGWLEGDLWDTYHDLRDGPDPATTSNTEVRVYDRVASAAAAAMAIGRNKIRSGTHFRIASAVLADISGAGWRACGCHGAPRCELCRGSGWVPPSNTSRSIACGSRHPEYMHRLRPVYECVWSGVNEDLRRGKAEYRRAYERIATPAPDLFTVTVR